MNNPLIERVSEREAELKPMTFTLAFTPEAD